MFMRKSNLRPFPFLIFVASLISCCLRQSQSSDGAAPAASSKTSQNSAAARVREATFTLLDTNSLGREFYSALSAISESPVLEKPTLWLTIANSSNYAKDRRCEAVRAFFKRHVKAPMQLADLLRTPGLTNWLSTTAVWKSTVGNMEFVDQTKSRCCYSLRPNFCGPRDPAITLAFKTYVADEAMEAYMTGTKHPGEIEIRAVWLPQHVIHHPEWEPLPPH